MQADESSEPFIRPNKRIPPSHPYFLFTLFNQHPLIHLGSYDEKKNFITSNQEESVNLTGLFLLKP